MHGDASPYCGVATITTGPRYTPDSPSARRGLVDEIDQLEKIVTEGQELVNMARERLGLFVPPHPQQASSEVTNGVPALPVSPICGRIMAISHHLIENNAAMRHLLESLQL